MTFEKMVTVTVDPASTWDGTNEMRSNIYFDPCIFNGSLTIVGDYHAMVSLNGGCSFGDVLLSPARRLPLASPKKSH